MDDGWAQEPLISALNAETTAASRSLIPRVSELEQPVVELRRSNGRTIGTGGHARPLIGTPTPLPVAATALQKRTREDQRGSQLFNFIGIFAIIFGACCALKLAIDHGLLGPVARILLGLIAGSAVVVWSERFCRRGPSALSYTLKAVGSSLLYVSLWAGSQLFHLFPASVAFAAMLLVTAWNGYMAWSQEAELITFYALIGGLLTLVLLSTGGDHEGFLFTYVAVIDLGTVFLLRMRRWPRLLVPALLGTAACFVGYYVRFFHSLPGTSGVWNAQSTETAIFAVGFAGIFSLVTTRIGSSDGVKGQTQWTSLLLPLANAGLLGGALAAVFEASGLHTALPWVMIVLAATFLAWVPLQKTSLAAAAHLAAAVVFLTIAISLKASGHTLTCAWLVEGLALFWISCTLRSETSLKCRALTLVSGTCYSLGLASLAAQWSSIWAGQVTQPLFTANLGSALITILTLGGATWLALPQLGAITRPPNLRVLLASLWALDAVALLLAVGELFSIPSPLRAAFANADFARILMSLALFGATAWISWHVAYPPKGPTPHRRQSQLFRLVTQVDVVLFNLLALFSLLRETSALWIQVSESLQRSLALSAVLMVYAGVLLATGFWRQQVFIRWQALVLILFTIAKVFLYDISGLSAGYRVAGFYALGVLLLTVSFAYQQDWLSLRTRTDATTGGEPT